MNAANPSSENRREPQGNARRMSRLEKRRHARRLALRARFAPRLPPLSLEVLEQRQLLTATPWSVDEMRDRLLSVRDTIKDVTIVTHGFQLPASIGSGDSLNSLSTAIYNRSGATKTWLLDYDVITQNVTGNGVFGSVIGQQGVGVFDADQSKITDAAHPTEVVLQWDWALESDEASAGWTSASGDALFATMVDLGLVFPSLGSQNPLTYHFIGHEYGCAVTSEAVERFAAYNIHVDQVTYLDPHDFNSGSPVEAAQQQWTVGAPAGYGASVWKNVGFTDAYYQTTGQTLVPQGRPIPGAYNRLLTPTELAGGSFAGDDTDVWAMFYTNTVKTTDSNSGFAYSLLAGGGTAPKTARPAPNFYSSGQDHSFTPTNYVTQDANTRLWVANEAGLAGLKVTKDQVIAGLWNPQVSRFEIYNGGIQYPGTSGVSVAGIGLNSDFVPGWSNHGGGGSGAVASANGNASLQLQSSTPSRAHNLLYVPSDAAALGFTIKRLTAGPADSLVVRLGTTEVGRFSLNGVDDGKVPRSLNLGGFTNQVSSLSFTIEHSGSSGSIGAVVQLDDVRFLTAEEAAAAAAIPPLSGPLELSSSRPSRTDEWDVPQEGAFLSFDMTRTKLSLNDSLVISANGQQLGAPLPLFAVDKTAITRHIFLPENLRGRTDQLTFTIQRSGQNNVVIDGVVKIENVRFTGVTGLTGDITEIHFSDLAGTSTAPASYAITGVSAVDPTDPTKLIRLRIRENPLRHDYEIYSTNSAGQQILAGYLLFPDRIKSTAQETATETFSSSGRAWFAPATAALTRVVDITVPGSISPYFARDTTATIAGDGDSADAGFQGRLIFSVAVKPQGGMASTLTAAVEIAPGHTGVDGPKADGSGISSLAVTADSAFLNVIRLQQRLNYWDGQTVAGKTITITDDSGQTLVVDGIIGPLTEAAIKRFKASTESGSVSSSATRTADIAEGNTLWRLNRVTSLTQADRDRLAESLRRAAVQFDFTSVAKFSATMPFVNLAGVDGVTSVARLIDNNLGLQSALFEPLANYLASAATPDLAGLKASLGANASRFLTFNALIGDEAEPGRFVFDVAFQRTVTTSAAFDIGGELSSRGFSIASEGDLALDVTATLSADLRFGLDLSRGDLGGSFFIQTYDLPATESQGITVNVSDIKLAANAFTLNAPFLEISINNPVLSASVAATATLPITTLAELESKPLNNLVSVAGSGSASLTLPATATIFPATATIPAITVSGTFVVSDTDITDSIAPTLQLPGLCNMARMIALDGTDVAAAFAKIGTFLGGIRSSGLLDDAIPMVEGMSLRDAARIDEAWNKYVVDVFKPSATTQPPATFQALLDRLSPLLGATKGTYNKDTCQLQLNFDLTRALGGETRTLNLSGRLGSLADLASASQITTSGVVGLKFTLGFDLSLVVGTDFELNESTKLSALNNQAGLGTTAAAGKNDFSIGLSDGTVYGVRVNPQGTVGELLSLLNALAPGRLIAQIEPRRQVTAWLSDKTKLSIDVDPLWTDDAVAAYVAKVVPAATTLTKPIVHERQGLVLRELRAPGATGSLTVTPLNGSNAADGLGILQTVDEADTTGEWRGRLVIRGQSLDGMSFADAVYLVAAAETPTTAANFPKITATAAATATAITATGRLGPVGITVANGQAAALVSATLSLIDPNLVTNTVGRITLREMGMKVASAARSVSFQNLLGGLSANYSIDASANLSLPITAKVFGKQIDAPDGIVASWSRHWNGGSPAIDLVGWWSDANVKYSSSLDDLLTMRSLSTADIIAALRRFVSYLSKAETDIPALKTKLPIVDKSLGEIISAGGAFEKLLAELEKSPGTLLDEIETAINKSLGLPKGQQVSLALEGKVFRIRLPIEEANTIQQGINLDLGNLGPVGNSLGRLIDFQGKAQIDFTWKVNIDLDLGIDLTDSSNPKAFLRDWDSSTNTGTQVKLSAAARGQSINFSTSIGSLGVQVKNGWVAIDADGSPTTIDNALIAIPLLGGTAGRLYLDRLEAATITPTVSGRFGLSLPLQDKTGTSLDASKPALTWSFDLKDLANPGSSYVLPDITAAASRLISDITTSLDALSSGWDGIFSLLEIAVDRNVLSAKRPRVGEQLQNAAR